MFRSTTSRALLGFVLIAALFLFGWVGVDVPGWERQVEALTAARSGIALASDSFRFSLRRGLVARGVEARAEVGGDTLVARAPRMILSLRPGPLLRGELVVGRITLEKPSIEIDSRAPLPQAGTERADIGPRGDGGTAEPGSGRVRFDIDSFRLENGEVVGRMEGGGGTTNLRGLDLELRRPRLADGATAGLAGLAGSGRIRAAEIGIERFRLPGVAADFDVERGRFRLESFEAWSESGRYAVDRLEVDLAQSPYRYRLAMRILDMDLGKLLGVGPGFGPVRAEVAASGEGSGLPGAVAEITLDLGAGELPTTALLSRLDAILGTSFVGAAYEPLVLEVSLVGSELELEPRELVAPGGRLAMGGTAHLDGTLDLTLDVVIPRQAPVAATLSEQALDLLGERGGWVRLPLVVRGRLERPRLAPGEAALEELGKRRGEAARGEIATVRSELARLLAQS